MATSETPPRPVVVVVNGPNLNLLGRREPDVYGTVTLGEIHERMRRKGDELGLTLDFEQSNSESQLIEAVHSAAGRAIGIVINPAAYTHTSVALRDAITAVAVPAVEVHLSNTASREEFRHHSYISSVAEAVIAGAGARGYVFALELLAERYRERRNAEVTG